MFELNDKSVGNYKKKLKHVCTIRDLFLILILKVENVKNFDTKNIIPNRAIIYTDNCRR